MAFFSDILSDDKESKGAKIEMPVSRLPKASYLQTQFTLGQCFGTQTLFASGSVVGSGSSIPTNASRALPGHCGREIGTSDVSASGGCEGETAMAAGKLRATRPDAPGGGTAPDVTQRLVAFEAGPRGSADLLDDLDQFVELVALAAGEGDEFFCLFDDGASLGCACDGDASSAPELQ
jgi:hypothetical protein